MRGSMCVLLLTCHRLRVEVRKLPSEPQKSNLGCQAWHQFFTTQAISKNNLKIKFQVRVFKKRPKSKALQSIMAIIS